MESCLFLPDVLCLYPSIFLLLRPNIHIYKAQRMCAEVTLRGKKECLEVRKDIYESRTISHHIYIWGPRGGGLKCVLLWTGTRVRLSMVIYWYPFKTNFEVVPSIAVNFITLTNAIKLRQSWEPFKQYSTKSTWSISCEANMNKSEFTKYATWSFDIWPFWSDLYEDALLHLCE